MNQEISLTEQEFISLVDFIKKNYGINLEKKKHLIEGRLGGLLSERGYKSFGEYFSFVLKSNSKDELAVLLNKLTTNHTYFMREQGHFSFFEKNVLPWLAREVKDKDLRIWSAGCSSGEEAYTIAMIMQDYFAEQSPLWDKKILATDICEDVLRKAVAGIYTAESAGRLPESWKYQYFHKIERDRYQVIAKMRREVIFRIFNLMDDFPFRRKFHVIFCRNVMIYFNQETKLKLLKKFYDMTADGGYLFIGMSESLPKKDMLYQYVMPSVYRKG